jgi:phosphate uptake regulator
VPESRHQLREELAQLERQALGGLEMVAQPFDRSLESLQNQDVELAGMVVVDDDRIDGRYLEVHQDLACQDPEINRLNRAIFSRAVELGDDVQAREWAMFMVLAARAIERIADNTIDIAEQTAFVVTGQLREFTNAPQPV